MLESSLDLYKKKYRAALSRVGELESQMLHLQEEVVNLWSSGQAEDSLGQLSAREMGWAMQLTGQQEQTIQELQKQLAVSHGKVRVARTLSPFPGGGEDTGVNRSRCQA